MRDADWVLTVTQKYREERLDYERAKRISELEAKLTNEERSFKSLWNSRKGWLDPCYISETQERDDWTHVIYLINLNISKNYEFKYLLPIFFFRI